MDSSKLNQRHPVSTENADSLFLFTAPNDDIIDLLPGLRLLPLPLAAPATNNAPAINLSDYGYSWDISLYGISLDGALAALIPHNKANNTLPAIWCLQRFADNPSAHARIHRLYVRLAKHKDASIAFDPTRLPADATLLLTKDAALLDANIGNIDQAYCGIIQLPASVTADELKRLCQKPHLTIDVTDLPQDLLDSLVFVHAGIRSRQHVVLLRNLEHVDHLHLPEAEIVITPLLDVAAGNIVAPKATYVEARRLAAVFGRMQLDALQFAEFPNLGRIMGGLFLPAAKGIGFPILSVLEGNAHDFQLGPVNTPILHRQVSSEPGPVSILREFPAPKAA